jgi:hypothetical protein
VTLPNSYYYNKIKRYFHTATCFLGLDQRNNAIINSALLDLVFSNISDLSACSSSSPVVTRNKYHPPLLLDFSLTPDSHLIFLTSHRSYAKGEYLLIYDVLRHSDWSYVLNENSVDCAMNNNHTNIVREAVYLAIPYIQSKNSTIPHWFSNYLKYYYKKKNQHFRGYKKSKCDHNYSVFLIIPNYLRPPLKLTGFIG